MNENPESQGPGTKPRTDKDVRADISDEVRRIVREAAQAESKGQYGLASLLALHVLQIEPSSAEASGILARCEAALGRRDKAAHAPSRPLPPPSPSTRLDQRAEQDFPGEALRHPIDLTGVSPLRPRPRPRGLDSRVFRTAFPLLILGALVAGIWLSARQQGPITPASAPAPQSPALGQVESAQASDPVADPRSGTLGPGTVALNVVPWARVDSIYSVYDGHQIEPDGLVSPCTVSLPPGRYTMTVSHPDFGSIELSVVVRSGEVTKINRSLLTDREFEKELAPVLESAGSAPVETSESRFRQSAELRLEWRR